MIIPGWMKEHMDKFFKDADERIAKRLANLDDEKSLVQLKREYIEYLESLPYGGIITSPDREMCSSTKIRR